MPEPTGVPLEQGRERCRLAAETESEMPSTCGRVCGSSIHFPGEHLGTPLVFRGGDAEMSQPVRN